MATNTTKARKVIADEATDATAELVTVVFKDVEFQISPDPMEWDFETMDHLADNRIGAALNGMIGDKQMAKFRALKPKTRDAIDFLNALSATVGVDDAGN